MLRGHFKSSNETTDPYFRWRGGDEITRIEAFTDAVFAFAVTLLVVALEVPHTFTDLANVMLGFPAFAICFTLLILVWHHHVVFFRRYGLQTTWAATLNAALLFVVLFYVYPLKFLFTMLVALVTGGATLHLPAGTRMIENHQVPALMAIYGLGYACIFLMFLLLNIHAWKLRDELGLNESERIATRESITNHAAMVAFGLVSAGLATVLNSRRSGLAGFLYGFVGVYYWIAGTYYGKRKLAAFERDHPPESLPAAAAAPVKTTPAVAAPKKD